MKRLQFEIKENIEFWNLSNIREYKLLFYFKTKVREQLKHQRAHSGNIFRGSKKKTSIHRISTTHFYFWGKKLLFETPASREISFCPKGITKENPKRRNFIHYECERKRKQILHSYIRRKRKKKEEKNENFPIKLSSKLLYWHLFAPFASSSVFFNF